MNPSPRRRIAIRVALVLTLLGAQALPAAERRKVVARVGEVALALHSVSVSRSASHAIGVNGTPPSRPAAIHTGATLEFSLGSRDPNAIAALVPGALPAPQFRATDDRGRTIVAEAAQIVEENEETRLRVRFRDLTPGIRSFRAVEGALSVYPQARRIRLHVPWTKEDLPVSVEYEGARATLRRFHLVGDESTLWVAVRPPDGMEVADPNLPGNLTARAMDIYGNLVSGGAITETVRTQAGPEPEFRFYAPVLRRIPSRLMLDVLCVAGRPRPVPFKTQPIQLRPGQ